MRCRWQGGKIEVETLMMITDFHQIINIYYSNNVKHVHSQDGLINRNWFLTSFIITNNLAYRNISSSMIWNVADIRSSWLTGEEQIHELLLYIPNCALHDRLFYLYYWSPNIKLRNHIQSLNWLQLWTWLYLVDL